MCLPIAARMRRKHTPSPFRRWQSSSTKTSLYVHSLKLMNKVLLLEDTKSKLLIKDDINDVLLMMEDTKYSARKEKVSNFKPLQHRAIAWYDLHYLQNPGHSCPERHSSLKWQETLKPAMYWNSICTIQSYVKRYWSCQNNKWRKLTNIGNYHC